MQRPYKTFGIARGTDNRLGTDFSNHQIFCGSRDPQEFRRIVTDALHRCLREAGFDPVSEEDKADRSFVLGPSGRWLQLGDTTGSTARLDRDAFDTLAQSLSFVAPVVDIVMSDDAIVHFYLYRDGKQVDKFGNGELPITCFSSEEAAQEYRGHTEKWLDLLLTPDRVEKLRQVWVPACRAWTPASDATRILEECILLFGWHPEFVQLGYSWDDEGLWMKYDEYFKDSNVDLSDLEEFHFQRRL